MWNPEYDANALTNKTETDSATGNRLVLIGRGWMGRMDWEFGITK